MKQPHTEQNIVHTEGTQNTGNHKAPEATDAKGADRFGGTRAGAGNVENSSLPTESAQSRPDVERLRDLEKKPTNDVARAPDAHPKRAPESDGGGKL